MSNNVAGGQGTIKIEANCLSPSLPSGRDSRRATSSRLSEGVSLQCLGEGLRSFCLIGANPGPANRRFRVLSAMAYGRGGCALTVAVKVPLVNGR